MKTQMHALQGVRAAMNEEEYILRAESSHTAWRNIWRRLSTAGSRHTRRTFLLHQTLSKNSKMTFGSL